MIRGIWDRETVALLLLAAMGPVALMWLSSEGTAALVRLVFVLGIVAAWQALWMLVRAQPPSLAGIVTALGIALLSPEDLGPGQLLLGTSFGVVMGELAFGGWGRNVVHPGTVALAFLAFGFPGAPWPDLAVQIGWGAMASLALGVLLGVLSLDLLLGAGLVLGAAALVGVTLGESLTAALVVLALLVADPVASASTRVGRWLNGALYAALMLLFSLVWAGAAPVQMAVAAALLATLAAPLLDEIAIALWMARRRRRFD